MSTKKNGFIARVSELLTSLDNMIMPDQSGDAQAMHSQDEGISSMSGTDGYEGVSDLDLQDVSTSAFSSDLGSEGMQFPDDPAAEITYQGCLRQCIQSYAGCIRALPQMADETVMALWMRSCFIEQDACKQACIQSGQSVKDGPPQADQLEGSGEVTGMEGAGQPGEQPPQQQGGGVQQPMNGGM